MARVLLLSKNEAFGLKVLYCLHTAGYEVDVLSVAKTNNIRYSRYRSRFHSLDSTLDTAKIEDAAAEWINREAPSRKWDAILADNVAAHGLLHAIRDRVKVPTFAPTSLEVLEKCHDKWTFYTTLKAAGISIPNSELLVSPESLTPEVAARVGFPLMVKPLNEESSNGVTRFDSYQALAEYLGTPGPFKKFPLKLQQYINAETLGTSFLAVDGEIICQDVQLQPKNGSRVFYDDPEVIEIGKRIVKVFNYGGPGNIDLVRDIDTGKLYALEFNCRFWYSVNVSVWHGGNFPDRAVKLARKEAIPHTPTRPGPCFPPNRVVGFLKHPAKLAKIDAGNWKGFWQSVSDPLPHLVNKLQ